jgi:hypothetical protein
MISAFAKNARPNLIVGRHAPISEYWRKTVAHIRIRAQAAGGRQQPCEPAEPARQPSTAACAAASRAIGTRNGLQLT